MTAVEPGYPPFDTLKPVADGVWIIDGSPIHPIGLPAPIRMTVIRLRNGGLFLHSPTPYDARLADDLRRLGPIRHLVAPSFGHWRFLKAWTEAFPDADTWAAPGLRRRWQVRAAGVRIDHELGATPPPAWADEIDQLLIGAGPFTEAAFFHQPSWTLVLTDLVQNLEPARNSPAWRGVIRLLGIAAPHGKAPAYLRLLLRSNRDAVAEAAQRLVDFRPERVIFAHGAWFAGDATARLRRSLDWLLAPPPLRRRQPNLLALGALGLGLAVGLLGLQAIRRRR